MEESKTFLYLVPTPIGNLKDITFRAVDVLGEVDVVLAEDTRTTGKLLKYYSISSKIKSFHIHNEHKVVDTIVQKMISGTRYALVTDAGTPGISDPGFLLVRAAINSKIKVECLPGPTAFVPALVKSGIPSDRFIFEGFLPTKKGRMKKLLKLAEEERTIVLFESPHRIKKTLQQIVEIFGKDRIISVSRELTKIYEETKTGTALEIKSYFEERDVKGEFVLVISGCD